MNTFGFEASRIIKEGRVAEEDVSFVKIWQHTNDYPKLTDEQIVQFLIACKNDVQFAKTTIEVYFRVKSTTPEVFDNRTVKDEGVRKMLQVQNFAVMPERYNESAILVINYKDTDYRNNDMTGNFKLASMTLDRIIFDDPPTDFIAIVDVKGLTLMHLTIINMKIAKGYMEYAQSGVPLRMKQVHLLNTNYAVYAGMKMLKYLFKTDFLSNLNFHSSSMNMESFHNTWIPKRCLPKEYGGDLESISYYHEKNIEKLTAMEPYFQAEQKQRSTI